MRIIFKQTASSRAQSAYSKICLELDVLIEFIKRSLLYPSADNFKASKMSFDCRAL